MYSLQVDTSSSSPFLHRLSFSATHSDSHHRDSHINCSTTKGTLSISTNTAAFGTSSICNISNSNPRSTTSRFGSGGTGNGTGVKGHLAPPLPPASSRTYHSSATKPTVFSTTIPKALPTVSLNTTTVTSSKKVHGSSTATSVRNVTCSTIPFPSSGCATPPGSNSSVINVCGQFGF